jgi:tRNA A-37 threonylcarbamoyl transferase component Bud32
MSGRGGDLVDVERFLEETSPGEPEDRTATWSGDSASTDPAAARPIASDEAEVRSLLGRVFHSYRATTHIGSGSCAHVFRGEHVRLDRKVAIKIVKPRYADAPVVLRRMEREAEVLVGLRHPNVVEGLELGVAGGLPFILLELLEGRTLLELIQIRGPIPVEAVRRFGRQIALGLSVLHERGVIHRDLKAGNLMVVGPEGAETVKVMDLGLLLYEETDATRLTVAKKILGTRSYMAPEQARDPRTVTPAADIYALGVVLHAMLTGKLPASGKSLPDFEGLGKLVEGLLQPDPARRPASAENIARALSDRAEPTAQTARRSPFHPTILGVVFMGLAVVLFALARELIPMPAPIERTPAAVHRATPIATVRSAGDAPAIEGEAEHPEDVVEPRRPKTRAPRPEPRTVEAPDRVDPARVEPIEPVPLASVRITKEEVERRLAGARERVRASAGDLDPKDLDVIEGRYLELRRDLAGAESQDDLDRLARSAHDFERDVKRALDGLSP